MLTLDRIFNASVVLKDILRETLVIKANGIAPSCDLFLKPECLQITGSFKVRGSGYKIANLTPEEKERGVIACYQETGELIDPLSSEAEPGEKSGRYYHAGPRNTNPISRLRMSES